MHSEGSHVPSALSFCQDDIVRVETTGMPKKMTQTQQTQKPPVRKKLSQDLLDELNMLSALAARAPEAVGQSQK
jgi:hypothetical protein